MPEKKKTGNIVIHTGGRCDSFTSISFCSFGFLGAPPTEWQDMTRDVSLDTLENINKHIQQALIWWYSMDSIVRL